MHRTILEDDHTYAVRIDDGAMLDTHQHIQHARQHLTPHARTQLAALLGCQADKLDTELDTLAARAKTKALKLTITAPIRHRARAGRYAYVHPRGQDFADTIWIIDPVFTLDLAREQLNNTGQPAPAREDTYFTAPGIADPELRDAAGEDRRRRETERARRAEAERSNLGLGHDITARLTDPPTASCTRSRPSSVTCSPATTAK